MQFNNPPFNLEIPPEETRDMQFNNPSLNLEILAEEAGEIIEILGRIIRIKSKIMRFGSKDHHPKNQTPNDQALEEEIGHFQAMTAILAEQGIISLHRINAHAKNKRNRLPEYYRPMGPAPVQPLKCSFCGKDTRGRQWWNREPGSGICPACVTWFKSTCKDAAQLRNCCGDNGYHYNVKE